MSGTIRRISLLLGSFCAVACVAIPTVSATTLADEAKMVVRVEVVDAKGAIKIWGSGVVIDIRGRILIDPTSIKPKTSATSDVIRICSSVNETSVATCTMRAVVRATTTEPSKLALLQVSEVLDSARGWITLDEYRLRHGNPFAGRAVSYDKKQQGSEGITYTDQVHTLTYGGTGNATVAYRVGVVKGFDRLFQKGKDVPWQVNTSVILASKMSGGAAFNASGTFIGMPMFTTSTKTSELAALPVINAFLSKSIGKDYTATTTKDLPKNFSEGVAGGFLSDLAVCPQYSTRVPGSKACHCNTGFFAVGESCMVGAVYCNIKGGTYDYYRQACTKK